MAYPRTNFIYNVTARKRNLGTFSWTSAKRLVLFGPVNGEPNIGHNVLSDIPFTPVAISGPLTNRGVNTAGYCKADSAEFSSLPANTRITFAVLVHDADPISGAELIAHYSDVVDFPMIADGLAYWFAPNGQGYLR
jgi:hypothetical protein